MNADRARSAATQAREAFESNPNEQNLRLMNDAEAKLEAQETIASRVQFQTLKKHRDGIHAEMMALAKGATREVYLKESAADVAEIVDAALRALPAIQRLKARVDKKNSDIYRAKALARELEREPSLCAPSLLPSGAASGAVGRELAARLRAKGFHGLDLAEWFHPDWASLRAEATAR